MAFRQYASIANEIEGFQVLSGNARGALSSGGAGGQLYDASGNMRMDGANQYLYDAEDRVCAVATQLLGSTRMTGYQYDAAGVRVAKGSITAWSCDAASNGFVASNDYLLGPGAGSPPRFAVQSGC